MKKDFNQVEIPKASPKVKVNVSPAQVDKIESNRTKVENVSDFIYYEMSKVEIENISTSIKRSAFAGCQTFDDFTKVLNDFDKENEAKEIRNYSALIESAKVAISSFAFASVTEKMLFFRKLVSAKNNTNNFRITLQNEADEDTTSTFENGAFFGKVTRMTAAGIRASFNSADIARTSIKRRENEKRANEANEKLAKMLGFTPEQLAAIPQAARLQMLRNLEK